MAGQPRKPGRERSGSQPVGNVGNQPQSRAVGDLSAEQPEVGPPMIYDTPRCPPSTRRCAFWRAPAAGIGNPGVQALPHQGWCTVPSAPLRFSRRPTLSPPFANSDRAQKTVSLRVFCTLSIRWGSASGAVTDIANSATTAGIWCLAGACRRQTSPKLRSWAPRSDFRVSFG